MRARRQRCTALVSDRSRRCTRWAMKGMEVCWTHGGANPKAQRSARRRLNDLIDPTITTLEVALQKAATRGAELSTPALRACQLILDRSGFGPHATVEVEDHSQSRAWANYATAAERRQLLKIMETCRRRQEAQEHAAGNGSPEKFPGQTAPPQRNLSQPADEVETL